MFKNVKKQTLRKQAGFTLVELSVVLAVVGLLFAAVVKGQEMVDLTKSVKLLNDIKHVESLVQKYATMKSRMPGDCDGNGVIDMAADSVSRQDTDNAARSTMYDFTTTRATYAAAAAAAGVNEGCAQINGTANPTSANVWINDLKLAGLVSDNVPNRVFAKQVNEDFMYVGKVTDKGAASADGADYNAIVVHNVPQWMARYVATAINGTDANADRNRVRSLTRDSTISAGKYEATWDVSAAGAASGAGAPLAASDSHRNSMVSIVYFFDRIPATL